MTSKTPGRQKCHGI